MAASLSSLVAGRPDPFALAADLLDPPTEPYASDPVGFARDVLGFQAWSKQAEIMQAVRDHLRVAVRSSHGPGKTATAAQIVLWFLRAHRNSRVITTAPTWQQVEQQLWREIRASVTRANDLTARPVFPAASTAKLELGEQWFALGLSTDSPERFQGHHATHILLVVDEASGVDEQIFEASEGFLTAEGARVLLLGNPTKVGGQFHRAFTVERASWHTIHISTFDTPNYTGEAVSPEIARQLPRQGWAEDRAKAWGETSPMYQVRVLGEFPSQASDAVLALHAVEAAQARELGADAQRQRCVVSCDVARYGDDETVIAVRVGNRVRIVEAYTAVPPGAQPTTHTAGLIISHARRFPAVHVHLVVDDAGLGGGVTDILREQGWPVSAHNGGLAPNDPEGYPNRRSELWFDFAEALGTLDLDDDEQLAADLTAPTYKLDSRGRRVVEPKAETKKRLGRSPDRGDAVLMCLVPPAAMPAMAVRSRGNTGDELALSDTNFLEADW